MYTAGLDGIIIKWDVQRLCNVHKIELKDCSGLRAMKIHEEKLVCSKYEACSEIIETLAFYPEHIDKQNWALIIIGLL